MISKLATTCFLGSVATLSIAAPPPHHHCESDAMPRALRLLDFHLNSGEATHVDVSLTPGYTLAKPVINPANPAQKLDVLEFNGQSGKGDFRIRLLYIQNAKVCAMVGQEIINWASY
ncbi:MAG: hypothetical protein KGL18_14130 [Burkholderiales bacterium]|nr:hypothetical protein [Burkholderiales bacterium]MDE1926725.1 hypothetical protein [Burkholderiales bacterium]MDE2158635.1 hypothetical protein [Burkholderiales bacterium]MDE2504097.1 hypothetical protein [Burkholderiales bacterium]